MINIVIADAQYLVRIGLKSLLSTVKDFNVIGEAANTKEYVVFDRLISNFRFIYLAS